MKSTLTALHKIRLTKEGLMVLLILYPCRFISSSGKESMMALSPPSGPGSLNLTEKAEEEKVLPCSALSNSTKGCMPKGYSTRARFLIVS
jgi:hypothetical protein